MSEHFAGIDDFKTFPGFRYIQLWSRLGTMSIQPVFFWYSSDGEHQTEDPVFLNNNHVASWLVNDDKRFFRAPSGLEPAWFVKALRAPLRTVAKQLKPPRASDCDRLRVELSWEWAFSKAEAAGALDWLNLALYSKVSLKQLSAVTGTDAWDAMDEYFPGRFNALQRYPERLLLLYALIYMRIHKMGRIGIYEAYNSYSELIPRNCTTRAGRFPLRRRAEGEKDFDTALKALRGALKRDDRHAARDAWWEGIDNANLLRDEKRAAEIYLEGARLLQRLNLKVQAKADLGWAEWCARSAKLDALLGQIEHAKKTL